MLPAKRNSMVRGAARRSPSTVSVMMSRPILDDGQAIDDALYLVELVGRQEDGSPFGDRLPNEPRELVLHERVEPGGRLIEYQQLRPMHEGQHDADLLPVPFREGPHRAIKDDVEPLDELVEEGAIVQASRMGREVDVLATRQTRVKCQSPGR